MRLTKKEIDVLSEGVNPSKIGRDCEEVVKELIFELRIIDNFNNFDWESLKGKKLKASKACFKLLRVEEECIVVDYTKCIVNSLSHEYIGSDIVYNILKGNYEEL
jgi:hypothetical protein